MLHTLAWFWIGYSDGFIYSLIDMTEITGYLVYTAPMIFLYFSCLFLFLKLSVQIFVVRRQIFILLFSISIFLFQEFFIDEFYIAGFAQVMAMIILIFFISDIFQANEKILKPQFSRSILIIHYVICIYAIFAWIVMRLTSVDVSLFISDIDNLSGFAVNRTSGLHREPSWAGYALASSYLGVFVTRSHRMLIPQLTFLLAIAVTGAGTGLIMAAFFMGHQILISKRGSFATRLAFLGAVGLLLAVVFSGRISDVVNLTDPSSRMRLESTIVAAEVIAETFPVGTGFGNYQDYAIFDPTIWSGLLDISEATYYKSDIVILNFIAELGFLGVILSIIFIYNFVNKGNLLILIMVIVMMLTSGTVIQPAYFILAAIVGLERARAAQQAARAPGVAL